MLQRETITHLRSKKCSYIAGEVHISVEYVAMVSDTEAKLVLYLEV